MHSAERHTMNDYNELVSALRGEGLSDEEIAAELHISTEEVEGLG